MTRSGWIGLTAVLLLSAGFAFANRGETAAVHLGFASFYRAPVAILMLGAFFLGMVVMFLLGLRHDLKVRRMLRERPPVAPRDDATELFPHSYSPPDLP